MIWPCFRYLSLMAIIPASPAAYTQNSPIERNAVNVLTASLDTTFIKTHFNSDDKVPNHDGYIELTTAEQVPIGKIDVQIKKLNKKNEKQPKYQCDLAFLSFCENSLLPVLLIVVNTDKGIAYWLHMKRDVLSELAKKIKKKSVSVAIPKENIITKTNKNYIKSWQTIVEYYKHRQVDYDVKEKALEETKRKLETLEKHADPSVGTERQEYKEIHQFLDHYNNLLDKEFKIVKEVFYNDYWKIGMAYSHYSKNTAEFILYPISFYRNDTQIKRLQHRNESLQIKEAQRSIGYYSENPIRRPKSFSLELIQKDVEKLVAQKALLFLNETVAQEYISTFVARFYFLLNLDRTQRRFTISEIEAGLKYYLQRWLHEYFNRVTEPMFYFNIDRLYGFTQEEKAVSARVRHHDEHQFNITISSKEFNLRYLFDLINFLKQKNVDTVTNPFLPGEKITATSNWIWSPYPLQTIKQNVATFYSLFPALYDQLLQDYFPLLFDELKYFKNYEKQLITIGMHHEHYKNYGPNICIYDLKCEGGVVDPTPFVFAEEEIPAPLRGNSIAVLLDRKISLQGKSYRFISARQGGTDFLYHKLPFYHQLYETLKKRLTKYFTERIQPEKPKFGTL